MILYSNFQSDKNASQTASIVSAEDDEIETIEAADDPEPILLKTEPETDHEEIPIIKIETHDDSDLDVLHHVPIQPANIGLPVILPVREADRNKRHKCAFCDRRFVRPAEVKRHEIAIHTSERQFKCDFCPWTFKRKAEFKKYSEIFSILK